MAKRSPRGRGEQPERRLRSLPTLEFHDDPAEFLQAAGEHLAADPVLGTVVATNADKAVRDDAAGVDHGLPHRWFVVVRDDTGQVVGTGMRTAPFAPHPLFLLPMPTDAAAALAHVLHARGERVEGVNGALPAARLCAGELARLTGRTAEVVVHTRLHEARAVVVSDAPPGGLRAVREDEVPLALAWFAAFAHDADVQAGRAPGSLHELTETEDGMRLRVAEGRLWFWVDTDDRPVHLTGQNAPAYGATRIGPVYTPAEHRGKGYAAATVARLTQRALDEGLRPCLYTDQANPFSNQLYEGIGYEPVVDLVDVRIA